MNNDLISREALKEKLQGHAHNGAYASFYVDDIIDNALSVNPCENCDLYFKAMTKEEMRKGGTE